MGASDELRRVVLRVRDVAVFRGSRAILDGVSFEIRARRRFDEDARSIVALLGPSGIGKTTLVRVLCGLEAPERGEVTGMDGGRARPGWAGAVFQEAPLLRHRRLRGNLVLAGRIAGLSHGDAGARADDLLERFGLAGVAGAWPAELSGGERRRAAIAQQLVRTRELLFLDEPFAGLDSRRRNEAIAEIEALSGTAEVGTIVVVTHDIRAALRIADQALLLGRESSDAGSKIIRKIDLAAQGFCCRATLEDRPCFTRLEREIDETLQGQP